MGCTNNLRMAKLKRRSNQSGAEPRTPNSSREVGKLSDKPEQLAYFRVCPLFFESEGAYLECGGFRRFGSSRMGCTNNLRMAKRKRRSNQSGAEPRTPNSSRVVGKLPDMSAHPGCFFAETF